jgi:hypothetical protein
MPVYQLLNTYLFSSILVQVKRLPNSCSAKFTVKYFRSVSLCNTFTDPFLRLDSHDFFKNVDRGALLRRWFTSPGVSLVRRLTA